MEETVSSMEEVYAYAVRQSNTVQVEDEQKIYDTPYEDDDCGPIYTKPPKVVEKIYETFEGRRFRKLYHQSIRYACTVCIATYVVIVMPTTTNCFTESRSNLVQESLGLLHVVC